MQIDGFKLEHLDGLHPVPVRGRFDDLVREGTGETVRFPFLHCEGWVDMLPGSGPGDPYVAFIHVLGMPRAWHDAGSGEWIGL